MPSPVCDGVRMSCSRGIGESRLRVPTRGVSHSGQSAVATIDDHLPMVNIPPFKACTAPSNPFTANPSGQKPCVPRFAEPWSDEVDFVVLHDKKLLEQRATLACDYAGTVRLLETGQQEITMDDNMLKLPLSLSGGTPP